MSSPLFTNLTALADNLPKTGIYGEVRHTLVMAWRAQSCLADIKQSRDCYDVLRRVLERERSMDTADLLTTERALLTTAIMLYARATSTSGKEGERGSIQLERGRLTPEQWKDHQALLSVRNQALAHVYTSQPVGEHLWHRELVFAVESPSRGWKVASASNQTGFHAGTVDRLGRMLPVAHGIVKEQFYRRMAAATKRINECVPQDLLLQHVFDPVRAFGSEEAVGVVLAGQESGEASLWVNE